MMNQGSMQGLMDEVNRMKKDLNKSASFLANKFSDLTKKYDFQKQKKVIVNNKPATMFLNIDNSILTVFEDPQVGSKLFESAKERK